MNTKHLQIDISNENLSSCETVSAGISSPTKTSSPSKRQRGSFMKEYSLFDFNHKSFDCRKTVSTRNSRPPLPNSKSPVKRHKLRY